MYSSSSSNDILCTFAVVVVDDVDDEVCCWKVFFVKFVEPGKDDGWSIVSFLAPPVPVSSSMFFVKPSCVALLDATVCVCA